MPRSRVVPRPYCAKAINLTRPQHHINRIRIYVYLEVEDRYLILVIDIRRYKKI